MWYFCWTRYGRCRNCSHTSRGPDEKRVLAGAAGCIKYILWSLGKACGPKFLPNPASFQSRLHSMHSAPKISGIDLAKQNSKYWCIFSMEFTWSGHRISVYFHRWPRNRWFLTSNKSILYIVCLLQLSETRGIVFSCAVVSQSCMIVLQYYRFNIFPRLATKCK